MITSGKEKERAQRLRLIARQYCDGEYNKIEYRRRRRELLEQCVARDHEPAARPEEPVAPEQRRSRSMAVQRDWTAYVMVSVTLVVVGVMGYLLLVMM
ncbi:MAG: hypothetical protein SV765_08730 [Pseudomonadota bacterium]|nr:hypothetical protein [Pseudomonadales bacterium]MDY6920286.1 hypothetical protein [Pseudomonadota bacterium]